MIQLRGGWGPGQGTLVDQCAGVGEQWADLAHHGYFSTSREFSTSLCAAGMAAERPGCVPPGRSSPSAGAHEAVAFADAWVLGLGAGGAGLRHGLAFWLQLLIDGTGMVAGELGCHWVRFCAWCSLSPSVV